MPSIQRYAILDQTKAAATVFRRDGEDWIGHQQIRDTILDPPEVIPTAQSDDRFLRGNG